VFAVDVDLTWDASIGATGYKVYKSEDLGVTWATPIDVGNVLVYKYLGVIETKMVIFRTSAYNANEESIRKWSGAWYDFTKKPINSPGGTGIQ
ncbi:MAG: hypothetical protein KJ954_13735, partial [Alphaproteobacteria bacterium]|nr:hypothetical protein [Alphaproteobacteria bacterium]